MQHYLPFVYINMEVLYDNFQAVKTHNLTKMWFMKIIDERVSIYPSESDPGLSHIWVFSSLFLYVCV